MSTTVGEYIKRDHDDFRLMFERLSATGPEDLDLRKEVYPFLKARIHAHHVAEEATVFPLMEKREDLAPVTLVLIAEHRGMDLLADDLLEMPFSHLLWRSRIFPFYDVIRAHWAREEDDVFVHAPYYFSATELADLGIQFRKILEKEWKNNGVHGAIPRTLYRR